LRCIVCHGERGQLYDGAARNSADQWACRPCQREPMPQLRAHLERARVAGMSFERAWPWALERVRWPHATAERREWKWLLGLEPDGTLMQARASARILMNWKAAYDRMPSRSQAALGELVAV
jgi:hypothetical protein